MNCPKCGSQTTSAQQFCRTCGAGLQTLPDLAAVSSQEHKRENVGEADSSPFNNIMRIGLFVMFAGVMIAIVGKTLLHLDLVTNVGVLMNVVGMFLIVYSLLGPSRRTNVNRVQTGHLKELPKAKTTGKLAPMSDIDFVPSVTERTTDLLETSVTDTNKLP